MNTTPQPTKLLATEPIEGSDQQREYFPVCFSRAGQRYHTVHLGYWTRFPNGRVSATRTICGTGDDGDPLGESLISVEDAITCPRCRTHRHAQPARHGVRSITLTRAEGQHSEVGHPRTATSWYEADTMLMLWGATAPQPGEGHHKVDFVVVFTDGVEYRGTYDLSYIFDHTLQEHVRSFVECASGRHKPAHMSEEQYGALLAYAGPTAQAGWREFLTLHDVGQL